jgi:hypothetical protein
VREQRWPWLLTAGLMLASAVAAAWSNYLRWLPCRGSMLRGSIIHDYGYDSRFSDLCLRRMDGDEGTWESELQVVAMVLLGVAWLTLVLGLRWQLRTKLAALPGLATLALAGAEAIGDAALGQDGEVLLILAVGIELSALVALVAILSDVDSPRFVRLLVVLWGTTAFGFIHVATEWVTMTSFSDANWDTPPGTGYLTVATITISAILTAIMTLLTPRRVADDEPHQDHHSGSLTPA